MNKEIAQKLLHELLECRKAIDSAEIVSREIDDENLRQEFRKILGRASLDLYSEAMGKIILRYPELDPYSKKNINKGDASQ
jgi:hypothetical protein